MKTCRLQSARVALGLAALLTASLFLTTCGGGGGGSNPPPGPSPLSITTSSLPEGIAQQPYSQFLSASGGKQPYTWRVVSGSLPAGLLLTTSGYLNGAPTESGQFGFTVQVRDSTSQSASRTLSLKLVELLVISSSLGAVLTYNLPYSQTLVAEGGTGSYMWTTTRDLPPGLTLSSSGVVSGTPTQAGEWLIDVHVQDPGPPAQSVSDWFHFQVFKDLTVLTGSLIQGVISHPYRDTLRAAGGVPPYSWRLVSGDLPAGLTFDPTTAEISGTPTEVRYAGILVEVSDSSDPRQTATRWVFCDISPKIYFGTTRLGDGVKGVDYSRHLNVYGGLQPYTARIVSGSLPPGVVMNNGPFEAGTGDYYFHGAPSATGTYSLTFEAADSSDPPDRISGEFSIRISEPLRITTLSLPSSLVGDPYRVTLGASGGILPYRWVASILAPGLTLSPDGVLGGTPTGVFIDDLYLGVIDSADPYQVTHVYLPLKIVGRLGITTSRLPAARPNVPYRASVGFTGGMAPYAWGITSGSLPNGLSLNTSTGEITGTPTSEGSRDFTVEVSNTEPIAQSASRTLSLTIASNLGRNDSPATATAISNGTLRASISPYADPVAGPANPDNDYYALAANRGAIVTIETMAKRLTPESPLDTVIELVDAAGNRLSTCRTYADGPFVEPCANDDIELGYVQDSRIQFQVPESATGPVTFYVRVLSWDGNARPDYVYDLTVSGAN